MLPPPSAPRSITKFDLPNFSRGHPHTACSALPCLSLSWKYLIKPFFFVYQRFHKLLTFRHSLHLTIVLKLVFFLGFWDVHFPDTWWSKNRQVGCWGWNCPQFPQFLPFRKRRAWRPGVLGGGGDSRTYLTKQYGLQLQCQKNYFEFLCMEA